MPPLVGDIHVLRAPRGHRGCGERRAVGRPAEQHEGLDAAKAGLAKVRPGLVSTRRWGDNVVDGALAPSRSGYK